MNVFFHAILCFVKRERCRTLCRGRFVQRLLIPTLTLAMKSWHEHVFGHLIAVQRLQRAQPALGGEFGVVLYIVFWRWHRCIKHLRYLSRLALFATSEQRELIDECFGTWYYFVAASRGSIEFPRAAAPTPASPPGPLHYSAEDGGYPTLSPQSLAGVLNGEPSAGRLANLPRENSLELESLVFEAAKQVVPGMRVEAIGPGVYKFGDSSFTIQMGSGNAGNHHAYAKRGLEWVLLPKFLEEVFPNAAVTATQRTSISTTPPRGTPRTSASRLSPRGTPRTSASSPISGRQTAVVPKSSQSSPVRTTRATTQATAQASAAASTQRPGALAKPGLMATAATAKAKASLAIAKSPPRAKQLGRGR